MDKSKQRCFVNWNQFEHSSASLVGISQGEQVLVLIRHELREGINEYELAFRRYDKKKDRFYNKALDEKAEDIVAFASTSGLKPNHIVDNLAPKIRVHQDVIEYVRKHSTALIVTEKEVIGPPLKKGEKVFITSQEEENKDYLTPRRVEYVVPCFDYPYLQIVCLSTIPTFGDVGC